VPIITLLGATSVTIEVGTTYEDEGATASDTYDGEISPSSIDITGTVNTAIIGTYTLTYNVRDAADNPAVTATRSVKVVDVQEISTWSGAVDNNYNNPANWSSNTAPTINNDIIIPPGATIDLSGDLNVNSMSISDGASLISDGTITGLISYTRTIPTTNWYLISSPLVGQDKDAFVTASNLATGT
jgi:hypothetical protein